MTRIAFTGPESSGKSRLAEAIAMELSGMYIEEFARTFLEKNGPDYDVEDLDIMAQGHQEAIEQCNANLQLIDTDFVVFKVWSEYKYDAASPLIHRLVSENLFDLHVLCAPDFPWEEDPLREHPESRNELFEIYLKTLERYCKPYIIVAGPHVNRVKKTTEAINQLRRIS